MKNSIQPLYENENGTIRFKENKIVRYLLDKGGIDMNDLARLDFTQDDREQFAQLIGYSLSGSSCLSYMSDETWETAHKMFHENKSELEAKIEYYEEVIKNVRKHLKGAVSSCFRIQEEDLEYLEES